MVGGLFLLAAMATATRAAEPKDWSVWSRVSKFRGYATVVTKYDTERAIGLANGRETGFEVETTSVRFVLERARPFHAEQMTWVMTTGEVAFQSLFGQKFQNDLGESSEVFQHAEYRGPPRDPHETSLTIEANSGRWQFVTPSHAAEQYTVISNVDNRRGDTAEQYTQTWKQDTIENAVFEAVAPRLLAPLVNQDTADRSRPEPGGKTTGSKEQRIQLFPDFDDVEVEVIIEGYADWLPRGNLASPQQPGNFLIVRAVLQPKGDAPELPVRAKSFRFELAEVTREPGVALNWPLNSQDTAPDLQFVVPGTDKLKTDVPPIRVSERKDEATARLAAHDFGAAGMLYVICALQDGRSVTGFLRHDGRQLCPIPLPYRRDTSLIADAWRKQWQVTGPDAEDRDPEPVGNGAVGDGFSNYEEYRGFIVGGQHIRTNPARKDFFVLNTIGRHAVPGLVHFASITKLTTHFELKPAELPETRRMNANRSAKSPRSTQEFQHAVILDANPVGEASETVTEGSVGRPKTTERVSVHPALFGPGRKPNEASSAIAHELLHSIGVKEHGDDDRDVAWIRNGDSVEERRAFWDATRQRWKPGANPGVTINVFDAQGRPVAVESLNFDDEGVLYLYVGERGGKASGVVDCVMRYDNANVFTIPERPRDRFLSGEEPVGLGLCDSAVGTDFNAPGTPLLRYGNARRGNCRHQFCVRDDAPDPKKSP